MGWFWQSTPSPKTPRDVSSTPAAPASEPPPSGPDAADGELKKFMDMIQAEMNDSGGGKSSSTSSRPSPTSRQTSRQTSPNATAPDPPVAASGRTAASRAISESLLPTEMSCRDAFDYAWHCHTPGAQWNAVYRYGSVRSCSALWDDFWFCMRVRGYGPDARAAAIRDHFRARENARYNQPDAPNSEDVWESRDEKVAPGTAFSQRFVGPDESDREWRLRELERRKAVREGMGFEKGGS